MAILSGPQWTQSFPGSSSLLDLKFPFDAAANAFISALKIAGATVNISATLRPPERAWLMHWAWMIARDRISPERVPINPGIDINWVHETPQRSRQAAIAMVDAYGMQRLHVAPALRSRHTEGHAIDMNINWYHNLKIKNNWGEYIIIQSVPRDGMNNELAQVGKTYGVIKYHGGFSDAPHWSIDGR